MHWQKIALAGVGLLGGSLGLALKERRLCRQVCGYVRREATAIEARRRGAVDDASLDLEQVVTAPS